MLSKPYVTNVCFSENETKVYSRYNHEEKLAFVNHWLVTMQCMVIFKKAISV